MTTLEPFSFQDAVTVSRRMIQLGAFTADEVAEWVALYRTEVPDPQSASDESLPIPEASAAQNLPGGHPPHENHRFLAAGDQTTEGHTASDAHSASALGSNHPPASVNTDPMTESLAAPSIPDGQTRPDAQSVAAVGGPNFHGQPS